MRAIRAVVLGAAIACASSLLIASPASAGPGANGTVTDPAGDNGPGYHPQADIAGVDVSFDTPLAHEMVTVTVRFAGNVLPPEHWEGQPTELDVAIDIDGDLGPDYVIVVEGRPGNSIWGDVFSADTGEYVCSVWPIPQTSPSDRLTLKVVARCPNAPHTVRAAAYIRYETAGTPPGNVSEDETGWSTPAVAPVPDGYWMLGARGEVYAFGEVSKHGGGARNAVDIEPAPYGGGYWILHADGHVRAHGNASGMIDDAVGLLAPGESPVSLSRTATGYGYWIFTDRGRVFEFGDAEFYGDLEGVRLNGPVLDSIPTASGRGYYMVASDGGIFAFGDAAFHGSMGGHRLNAPVMSLVPDGDGIGYWLVASDGGIFAFNAPFRGSMGGVRLNRPVTGMVRHGDGYLMVGEDGGIFNFSDLPFYGSLGGNPPAVPIVSVASSG